MNVPRPFKPVMSFAWWLERPNYIRYMLRELTCVWIGAYVVVLIIGLFCLREGKAEWQAYLDVLSSAPGLVFQFLALAFTLYHTISWFSLAPSTMPLWHGETRVSPRLIEIAHYIAWIGVSVFIVWLAGV